MTLTAIIIWLIIGLVVGGLAHLLVPGRNRVGIIRTVLFGIVGALVGGVVTAVGGVVTAALIGAGHLIITFLVSLAVAALLIALDTRRPYLRRGHSRRRLYYRRRLHR
jgi:uncharacterized membrane protein YeaQ/YmgE (transglycosylase-associated protein family)